jgi:flagellar basal body-associated protein FliL
LITRIAVMKKKLLIVVPIMLLVFVGTWKLVLANESEPKAKVDGIVYVLPKEFLINLSDDRYAKLSVALVLNHSHEAEIAGQASGHASAKPAEGFGSLAQEAVVRDIVTSTVTNSKADEVISQHGRERLKRQVLRRIRSETDVRAEEILFTDVAVQ